MDSLERVAAAIALSLLLPALGCIAIVIAVLSRRGPLVTHTRVGLQREPLHMLKFRTMWESSTHVGGFSMIENVSDMVPERKEAGDTRISSRFAAFCRRHSIDELPQLYHVVRGEMSLVGPRPVTLVELERHYSECMDEVLSIRPGLTGLWQVKGRNQLTYVRRRRLDLIYVRRRSAGLYLRILLRSIPRVLSGRGAC
jgi:lipopolysaccharide/colanic/teichoic acid biosynthesis glycosyltransferase